MQQSLDQYEGKFRQPQLITERLFPGKLPDDAFELRGPVVDLGTFTWKIVHTAQHPIALPLSGRAGALCLVESNNCNAFAASILPDVDPTIFASSSKIAAIVREFMTRQCEVKILISEESEAIANRGMIRVLLALGIGLNEFTVLKAQGSPAYHPIIKDGRFSIVDASVIRSMSDHQLEHPTPTWSPIKMR